MIRPRNKQVILHLYVDAEEENCITVPRYAEDYRRNSLEIGMEDHIHETDQPKINVKISPLML
jgi:hypothetical protein